MPRIRTDFPYETRHEDLRIPMPDGILLYARAWRPLTDEPVPALLEYDPHRLTDATAARDAQRHPWYAGHGYASVRVDVRGHGNSEGLPGDAHDATELADGDAVVHWLAEQPWCTGRVGMVGIGRGGAHALRIAALAPEPLKAVVTVCAAADRPPLASVCRPPDPRYAGEAWREMWLERLEAVEPFLPTWLTHQAGDSAHEHPTAIDPASLDPAELQAAGLQAAVLAVGGWHDPYRDTVLRLVEHLPRDRVRGVIGPWAHQYPDRDLPPGPAIGFLQETLRWWDHHLKGIENDVMAEPLLRSWISASHPPATVYEELPGRWVADPSWPSPHVTPVTYGLGGGAVVVASPQRTGLDAGAPVPRGNDADLPPDQRAEDAHAACFDFTVPEDGPAIEILGRPSVRLRLTPHAPSGQVIARLCDIAPDGASTLVTRGVLDLSRAAVGARTGRTEAYDVELSGIGHAFPPGHRVRLAVSSAYWPWIWPTPDGAGFTLDPAGSSLTLPVRAATDDAAAVAFEEPEQSEPLVVGIPRTLEEPRPERLVVRDVAKGEWRLEVDPCPGGTRVFPDGLEYTEDALETYVIDESGPLSARTRTEWAIRLHRPESAWDVKIDTRSEISCDAEAFHLSDEVICTEGEEIVFHRTWEKHIPRTEG
ncbi:CocE/NonD family hydrolase [Streptomyces sp. NPDC006339]|uniref:CocE/NonD family hydrolase n=1 Tax=Streptomyces sp. NPDC006339 TaxID=3156755 RepID=UPI0033A13352